MRATATKTGVYQWIVLPKCGIQICRGFPIASEDAPATEELWKAASRAGEECRRSEVTRLSRGLELYQPSRLQEIKDNLLKQIKYYQELSSQATDERLRRASIELASLKRKIMRIPIAAVLRRYTLKQARAQAAQSR